MHQHVSILAFSFNFIKGILLPNLNCIYNCIFKSNLLFLKEFQILGCYNSTPLKMNLVPEIRGDSDKRDADSSPLDSSLPCIPVNFTPSNLSN